MPSACSPLYTAVIRNDGIVPARLGRIALVPEIPVGRHLVRQLRCPLVVGADHIVRGGEWVGDVANQHRRPGRLVQLQLDRNRDPEVPAAAPSARPPQVLLQLFRRAVVK